jgi:hypothetical protein
MKLRGSWDKSSGQQEYLQKGVVVRNQIHVRLCGLISLPLALAVLVFGVGAQRALGQTEKASVSGRVTDQTNAVMPDVEVEIKNTDTGIVASVRTNDQGIYLLPSLAPGNYVMAVRKQGFRTVSVMGLTLYVQDSLSRNFVMQVGSSVESVTVTAESGAGLINQTGSELGTVITQQAVHELPLNGRNFTQLLTLTPGATPISTSQSAGVGVNDLSVIGVPTASVAQPSIQGQNNRSNLYLLDGVINTELNTSTYVIPPIVDAIQEFKVQSHDDKAEYGSVLGGIVSVVTRSGSNRLHGSAWEFLRNNAFDARDPFKDEFLSSPSPFRQNQFGATISGPVVIPKVYNGHNRTFFLFGYEGWRFSQAAQSRYRVPTDQELSGNFSGSVLQQNIYDPTTTRPDPANPGGSIRHQFAGNIIPANRIDQTVVSFIKTYFGAANLTGDPVYNAIVTKSHVDNSDHYTARIDEQLGDKDALFFRYDRLNVLDLNPITNSENSGGSVPATDIGAGWNHLFSASLMLETRFGRAHRPFSRFQTDAAGIAPMQKLGFTSAGGSKISLGAPYGASTSVLVQISPGVQNPNTIGSPVIDFSQGLTWTHRSHDFKFGYQYIKQGNDSASPPYGAYTFTNDTTGNPEAVGTSGNSLASALLGLPSETNNTVTVSNSNRVSTWSLYGQDTWKLRSNLTVTYGLRLDHRRPFGPSSSTVVSGFTPNGDYWIGLKQLPPACTQTGKSPCLPGDGTLQSIPNSDKIMLSPYGRAWGPAPNWSDWGPRLGIAWRLREKTVVRAGYGIVYDALMGIEQDWKGIAGSWPATGSVSGMRSLNQLGQPLTPIEQTLGQVTTALPDPTPWSQSNWFFDPNRKDPRSQQWNVEIQKQMAANLAFSIGYVGSYSDRLDSTGLFNTAQTPGPGTPAEVNARRPFPWINGTPFFGTDRGNGNYNALEVRLDRRFASGFQYIVSYTWSKAIDTGSSGWFAAENGPGGSSSFQNYYDPNGSRSVSSYDIPHFLSMSGVWELPFGRGKKYFNQHGAASWILGNWQTNAVVQLRSGQPYNLTVPGDVANIGNTLSFWNYGRPNLLGNPRPAHPTTQQWFNPNAFAVPSFSYGNFGRNVLRSPSVYDADFSLFKNFPVTESILVSFRMEFFNVFNMQNYGVPNSLIGDPGVGRITSVVIPPRQIQFGLHLSF